MFNKRRNEGAACKHTTKKCTFECAFFALQINVMYHVMLMAADQASAKHLGQQIRLGQCLRSKECHRISFSSVFKEVLELQGLQP
jgi:hypothetical protein